MPRESDLPLTPQKLVKMLFPATFKPEKARKYIEEHPNVINTVDSYGHHILVLALANCRGPHVTSPRILELIKLIITHPDFLPGYVNRSGRTNIEELIKSGEVDLIKLIQDKETTILHDPQLPCVFAINLLRKHSFKLKDEETISQDFQPKPKHIKRKAQLTEIVDILAEKTIQYAITHRRADILERMAQAGYDLSKNLGFKGKGPTPFSLIDQTDSKNSGLLAWFEQYERERAATLAYFPKKESGFKNPAKTLATLFGKKEPDHNLDYIDQIKDMVAEATPMTETDRLAFVRGHLLFLLRHNKEECARPYHTSEEQYILRQYQLEQVKIMMAVLAHATKGWQVLSEQDKVTAATAFKDLLDYQVIDPARRFGA